MKPFLSNNEGEVYFLSLHQPISTISLDKLNVYRFIFCPNGTTLMMATALMKATTSPLVSSDVNLVHLFVEQHSFERGQ